MLIDADHPKHISLQEYEGVVIRVPFRAGWEKRATYDRAQAGVWYLYEREAPVELDPVPEEEPTVHRLYRLRPGRRLGDGMEVAYHRYLVRYWAMDMYVPRHESLVISFTELREGNWELHLPNVSLFGIGI
jgi:hypothetical protein